LLREINKFISSKNRQPAVYVQNNVSPTGLKMLYDD